MNKVCVVGSINIDMVTTTPRIPSLGETIHGEGFITVPGGKGANQAVAAARLGAQVTMVGCVGDDGFGREMLENFAADGICTDCIRTIAGTETGTATILVCGGDNLIILNKGANACVSPEMVAECGGLLCDADVIMLQNEIPPETNRAVFEQAHGLILYNPAPSAKVIPDYLYKSDLLVVNEHEGGDITGIKIDSVDAAKEAAKKLLSDGVRNVIITLGGDGAVYTDAGNVYAHSAVRVENVVDTTAAGDCFCGATAKCLACGGTIHNAIAYATAASAITVTKKGAQASIPTHEQVEKLRKELGI